MTAATKRLYACARCGRKLKPERWVYSHFTGQRYCLPGDGCMKGEK